MKKIIFSIAFAISLFGENVAVKNSEYIDVTKLDIVDIRAFVGVDGAYQYSLSSENLDKTGFGFSVYAGVPIFDTELIIKKQLSSTNALELDNNSIALNIPFGGTGSRLLYAGIIGGNSKVTFNESTANSYGLVDRANDGNFYGLHIGKRYKFSENFFGRLEFEYLKYNFDVKTQSGKDFSLDSSFGAIYGVEYRF